MRKMYSTVMVAVLLTTLVSTSFAQAPNAAALKNVVLVHGAYADGSGYQKVYAMLKQKGYNVAIVQNPLTSLADDVAAAKRVIASMGGPVVLVGHSWGGVVITEAGNDPNVAGLVYVAAFAPDAGESVNSLFSGLPKDAPPPPVAPTQDGFLFIDRSKFAAVFAADSDPKQAEFLANSQVPINSASFDSKVSAAAWRTKPSWFLVAAQDQLIPPDLQRTMAKRAGATVVEGKGSHSIYLSKPEAVVSMIESAARGK